MVSSLKEELKWKQHAKLTWLQQGDQNTNYIHHCASQIRKRNHISQVIHADDVIQMDPTSIEYDFTRCYQQLYTSSNPI